MLFRSETQEELERLAREREIDLRRRMQEEMDRAVREARDKALQDAMKMTKEE